MDFKALNNYKHARSSLALVVILDQMFVLQMVSSPHMARNMYSLMANCKETDETEPLRVEKHFTDRFMRMTGTFSLITKLLAAFVSLDNKLKVNKDKDMSINETAVFIQGVIAEAMGVRKNGKITIDDFIKDRVFEEIDNFIYALEQ